MPQFSRGPRVGGEAQRGDKVPARQLQHFAGLLHGNRLDPIGSVDALDLGVGEDPGPGPPHLFDGVCVGAEHLSAVDEGDRGGDLVQAQRPAECTVPAADDDVPAGQSLRVRHRR
jgi:hypothetical protein